MSDFISEFKRAYSESRAKGTGEGPKPAGIGRQIAAVVVGSFAIWVVVQVFSGGGVLSNAQTEACKFDFGQAFFNIYGGSFDDYDFAKAQLQSANKVNKSADDFTNYLYEIPSRKDGQPITCAIYKHSGRWLSVTKNPW